MNHFPLELPPSDTLFYTTMNAPHDPHHKTPFPFFYQHHPHTRTHQDDDSDQSSSAAANDTRSETASSSADHREPMFEKPLTPSDVGKLNRLVIPKQHAEKYFPLSAAAASPSDAGSGGGGILLGFEDECGKCWRFRYSYWNSSQSYVLTKGWSRYVKEKKLDAGDVVFFDRHRFEPDRFFIGWRRRGAPAQPASTHAEFGGWCQTQRSSYNGVQQGYPAPQPQRIAACHPYLPADFFHAGREVRQQGQKAGRSGGVNSKRLRLFGVNLECQLDEEDQDAEPQTSDGSSLSSQGPVHGSGPSGGPMGYNYFDYMGYPPNHHSHMDMNFPQDLNQMRNRLG